MVKRLKVKVIIVLLFIACFAIAVASIANAETSSVDADGDGVDEFIIHYQSGDFHTGSDPGGWPWPASTSIIQEVDNAIRNAWNIICTNNQFSEPSDSVIDIYIWDGTNKYWTSDGVNVVTSDAPGMTRWASNGNAYIFVRNDLSYIVGGVYPSYQDAYTVVVGHEFFHAVQASYSVAGCEEWISEGSAEFMNSVLDPTGEFWNSGTQYSEYLHYCCRYLDPNQGLGGISHTDSLTDPAMDPNKVYSTGLYWRFIYENYGGMPTILNIFNAIKNLPNPLSNDDDISAINSILGTTDIGFTRFSEVNYLAFTPSSPDYHSGYYQNGNLYYADLLHEDVSLTPGSPVELSNTLPSYSSRYYEVNPAGLSFVKVDFTVSSGTYSALLFTIDSDGVKVYDLLSPEASGSIGIPDASSYTAIGVMIVQTGAGTGSYTLRFNSLLPITVNAQADKLDVNEGDLVLLTGTGTDPNQGTKFFDSNWVALWPNGWSSHYHEDEPTIDTTFPYRPYDNGVYKCTYTVLSRVDDTVGWMEASGYAEVDITVNNVPPTVDPVTIVSVTKPDGTPGDPNNILPGDTVVFSAAFTDPGCLDTFTATWDFGDGITADSVNDPSVVTLSSEQKTIETNHAIAVGTTTATHTYTAPLTGSATVDVADDDMGMSPRSLPVKVNDAGEDSQNLRDYIVNLPASDFTGNVPQEKTALSNSFNALNNMFRDKRYAEMVTKLNEDIRAKADGSLGGNPKNDWITDKAAQQYICTEIDHLTAYIKTLQ